MFTVVVIGNSRRLKAYISALYRHLGSILRNKGPMKSGLDADLVSIQTGFSKQRLAYCLGKFHDPGVSKEFTTIDVEFLHINRIWCGVV